MTRVSSGFVANAVPLALVLAGASAAVAGGRLHFRGERHLFAIDAAAGS